jgi:hypothetical protein
VTVRRLLGAALMVSVLLGGLVLVTAGPAAACSCLGWRSEAEIATRADAVFVGTLISQATQIDPRVEQAQREFTRTSDQRVLIRALRNNTSRTVWMFQVSRVYKGAVGERQDIISPADTCGLTPHDTGPFLVFAWQPSPDMSRQYQLEPGQYSSNLCSGSRPLADGGEPDLGAPRAGEPGWPDSLVGIVVLAAVVAAGLGLAALRARRRASAD